MSKRSGRQAKQFYSSLRSLLHPDIFPYKQTQILCALCTLIGQLGLKPMFYEVNKPLQLAAGTLEDDPEAERLTSEK